MFVQELPCSIPVLVYLVVSGDDEFITLNLKSDDTDVGTIKIASGIGSIHGLREFSGFGTLGTSSGTLYSFTLKAVSEGERILQVSVMSDEDGQVRDTLSLPIQIHLTDLSRAPAENILAARVEASGSRLGEDARRLIRRSSREAAQLGAGVLGPDHLFITIRQMFGQKTDLPAVRTLREASERHIGRYVFVGRAAEPQPVGVVEALFDQAAQEAPGLVYVEIIHRLMRESWEPFLNSLLRYSNLKDWPIRGK